MPSPDNLRRWQRRGNLVCGLCSRPFVTSSHILAGCGWVFNWENKCPKEDRYTWRHNCVLSVIMRHLSNFLSRLNSLPLKWASPNIRFVKPGSTNTHRSRARSNSGILQKARDWKLDCDLPEWHNRDSRYVLPHKAVISGSKPDIFLISDCRKLIIFLELTCPLEENMDHWRSEKTNRYCALSSNLNTGWSSHIFTIEVGAKGFVNNSSFFKTFGRLGFSSRSSRKLLNDCSRESVRSSYIIWLNRFNKSMIMSRLSPFAPPPTLLFGQSTHLTHVNDPSSVHILPPSTIDTVNSCLTVVTLPPPSFPCTSLSSSTNSRLDHARPSPSLSLPAPFDGGFTIVSPHHILGGVR